MRILAVLCLFCCTNLFAMDHSYPQLVKKPVARAKSKNNHSVPLDIQDQQRSTENTSAGRI